MTSWQQGTAPGVVDVRVSGEMADIVRLTDLLSRVPGVEVLATHGPRPNRRNPGVRVHLTVRVGQAVGREDQR